MPTPQLAPGVYWVGSVDWDLRYFHGYITQRGSSYNAYLVVDEKIALIDTVKAPFAKTLLENVADIVSLDKVDYVISLHVEMDHSGSLPQVLKACPNATLITSAPAGLSGLIAHFGSLEAQTVKTGDIINLGRTSLHFVQTPMLHWPDNTVAFMPEEGILFSSDAFGQHYASSARFDDESAAQKLFYEAAKYYANIVLPFGSQTLKALDTLAPLKPQILAPSHGIIWRSLTKEILTEYAKWGSQQLENKAVVVYDTMWHSTQTMAETITQAFMDQDLEVAQMNLQANHMSDVMAALLTAKYIAIGSSTINNNMLPSVAGFLTYMKGLAPKGRIGLAFGSYGWSGQSPQHISEIMDSLGWEQPCPAQRIRYIPDKEALQQLKQAVWNMVEKP
ncbi:MAG: FprA family A-type flavoprotein [Clostridiales bacterium]|nr:FprA family A-type flavoprotein [Clostridiales bacterium]